MAFAFVQGANSGDNTFGSSNSAAFSTAVTLGHMVAGTAAASGSTTVSSITDDGTGGTWKVKSTTQDTFTVVSFYGWGWSAKPTTITVNWAAGMSNHILSIVEFSGQASGDPINDVNFAQQVDTNPGTGTDAVTANASNLLPTVANCLLYSGVVREDTFSGGGASIWTAGTNYTKPSSAEHNVLGDYSTASEYWIQTTATGNKGTWTQNQATMTAICNIMIFKPAVLPILMGAIMV